MTSQYPTRYSEQIQQDEKLVQDLQSVYKTEYNQKQKLEQFCRFSESLLGTLTNHPTRGKPLSPEWSMFVKDDTLLAIWKNAKDRESYRLAVERLDSDRRVQFERQAAVINKIQNSIWKIQNKLRGLYKELEVERLALIVAEKRKKEKAKKGKDAT